MNSSKKTIFTIAAVLIGLLISLFIAEIAIRISNAVDHKERKIWIPDPYLGMVHAPNNKFRYQDDAKVEFDIQHRTNSFGLMGPEISLEKANDVFRIILLGDSYTEALQVEEGKSFARRLESMLQQDFRVKGKSVEVLNAGVSGYSPIIQYLYFKRDLAKLNPDLVVLQLFTNDVFEDNKFKAMSLLDSEGFPVKIHTYFLDKYSKAIYFYRFHQWLLNVSRFYEYVYTWSVKRNKNLPINKEMRQLDEFHDINQFFIVQDDRPLFKDITFRDQAWANTEKYLSKLNNLVQQKDADFALFYIPTEAQLTLVEYSPHAQMYFSRQANTYFNDLLVNFSQTYQVPFLDLLDRFELLKQEGLYYPGDGHLNEKGHRVVAKALYDFLLQNNLLEKIVP